MSTLRVLPLVLGISMASQVAQAADLLTIAQDALLNNASLAADRAGVNATQEGEAIARGSLLPQVTANGNITRYHVSNSESSRASSGLASGGDSTYNSSAIELQATQSLFDATNWYTLQAAKRQSAQESLNFSNNRQVMLYNVASAYFEVLRAKELLDTYRAAEAAYQRQLDQTREQFDVGVIASTDVREAEASYDSARAQRISQESILRVNFEALEQLTGKQYPSIDRLSDELPIQPPEPTSRQAWVEMASTQNLALRAARAGIDLARENVKVARAGHLPTLSAVANYQYGDSNRSNYIGYDESNSIGLQATLPIYTGGSTSAQVRQNTYSLEQAQFTAEEQLRTAVQQVSSFFAQANNDVLTVEARQRAIVSNRAALQATQDGYDAGTRTILDVLTAQQNYYTALSDYASARYDYVLNMLSLRQQAGVLDVDTLDVLNRWLVVDDNPIRIDAQGEQPIGDAQIDLSQMGMQQ